MYRLVRKHRAQVRHHPIQRLEVKYWYYIWHIGIHTYMLIIINYDIACACDVNNKLYITN